MSMHQTARAPVVILLFLLGFASIEPCGADRKSIAEIPAGLVPLRILAAGKNLAYVAKDGDSYFVLAQGRRYGPFEYVYDLCWSPDGEKFAFRALGGGQDWVFRGTDRLGPYDKPEKYPSALRWLDDGSGLYFAASREGVSYLVRGETEIPLSPPAKAAAYTYQSGTFIFRKGEERWIAHGGGIFGPYALATAFFTGADGPRAYVWSPFGSQAKCTLEVEGKTFGPYEFIRGISVLKDGSRVAYIEQVGKEYRTYLDGRLIGSSPQGNGQCHLALSPDGTTVAFRFLDGTGKAYVEVGGRRLGPYDSVSLLRWSPTGGRLAFSYSEGKAEYVYADGERMGPYGKVMNLAWSPDGRKLSVKDGYHRIVADGRTLGPFEIASDESWSPDGSILAFFEDFPDSTRSIHVGSSVFGPFQGAYSPAWASVGAVFSCHVNLPAGGAMNDEFTKVFLRGKMLTGCVSGSRIIYQEGNSLYEE